MSISTLFATVKKLVQRKHSNHQRRNARRHALSLERLDARLMLTAYFIDPVRGSDSNPGMTADLPFRTPRNISFSTSEGNANYRA